LPNDPLSATIPPVPSSSQYANSQYDDLTHWSPDRPGLDQPRADPLAPKVTSSQDPFQQANFSNGTPQPNTNAPAPPLSTYAGQPSNTASTNYTTPPSYTGQPGYITQPNFPKVPDAAANPSNIDPRSTPLGHAAPLPGTNMMRHQIQDGDNLQLLAQHYYGDARRADELFAINRDTLKNPELLPLGATLQIPGSITSQPFVAPTMTNSQSGAAANPGYQSPIPQSPSQNPSPNGLPNSANSTGSYIRPISTVSQPPPFDSFQRQNIAPPTIYSGNNSEPNASPHTSLLPIGQPNSTNKNPAQNQSNNSPSSNPQPGWPPQSAANQNPAGWPPNSARTNSGSSFTNGMKTFGDNIWQGSTSAMNWVGNNVLGSNKTAPAPLEKTYIVRAGDSWETLANRFYGDKAQAMKLFQANSNGLNGMVALRPGMVIEVPPK
jgi:nucleoid-associated protein YgaU